MSRLSYIMIFVLAALNSSCNSSNNKPNKNSFSCFCDEDTLINNFTIACDTAKLSNNTKLYWQFNCDRIWLTLENISGQKIVINEVPIGLNPYTYRLGFQLIKEFDKTILFRNDCAATGPCVYTLIEKNTGAKIEEFEQLVCIDAVDEKYDFDFIVYLSNDSDHLVIYFVDTKKTLEIPFTESLTNSAYPQDQFDQMILQNDTLSLTYGLSDNIKKTLLIDLNEGNYRFSENE